MSDPTKLSYDPVNIPQPVTTQDVYMHANLVEQRLIRKALTRIADALDTQSAPVASSAIQTAVDTAIAASGVKTDKRVKTGN